MAEILVRHCLADNQKRANAKQKRANVKQKTDMAKQKTFEADKQTQQLINRRQWWTIATRIRDQKKKNI